MHPDVVLGIADTPHGNPNAITRRGGAMLKQVQPKDPTLVVDVREFMSSLPAVLYQQGLTLLPVTLEVCFLQSLGLACGMCDQVFSL